MPLGLGPSAGGGGVSDFLGLTDAPATYVGQAGKVLAVNVAETELEFISASGVGTVTSVALSGGTTGLTASGSPITAAGTFTLGGTLVVANGGTGATTAADARTNLGLAIGTNVQAYDASLTSLAALGTAADKIAYTTGVDTWAETALTSFGRSLIDDASASDARTTLGLGTLATQNGTISDYLTTATAASTYQPLDSDLTALAGLSTTNIVPVRTGAGTWSGSSFINETSFTPTVTLVGGSGNTVPQYTTNAGYYCRIGNRVFVDVYLNGDGGNEGAGTGQINIALPVAASVNAQSGELACGSRRNGTTYVFLFGVVAASATTIALSRIISGTLSNETGTEQNNTTRSIRLHFSYPVD